MKKLPEGLYEQVINQYIQNLKKIDQQYDTIPIRDAADIPSLLTHYLVPVLKKSLTILEEKHEPLNNQIERCNEIINQLSLWTGEEHLNNCQVTPDGEILLSVIDKEQVKIRPQITRPITSLSHSSLFTGSRDEPSLLQELKAEIASSDRIDMLVSFIKWSGIRLLMDELSQFCNHGRLRVLPPSYIGATDPRQFNFYHNSQTQKFVFHMILSEQGFMQRPIIFPGIRIFISLCWIFKSSNPAITSDLN